MADIMPYLTIIPDRVPRQKAHTNLGQAKKAVLFRLRDDGDEGLSTPIKVYKWTDSGWELMWDIAEGTPREAMPWVKA
jgi:hypothetical protein